MIIVFVAYCVFLLALSVLKSTESFLPAIYQFEAWLGGDKLMHLKLSALLSLLACIVSHEFKRLYALNIIWRVFVIQLLLTLSLLADEAHQYLMATRRFEWADFSYGAAGLLIGLFAYLISFKISWLLLSGRR